ncbi:macrolide family glycosyltransferase [Shimazuella kribbensis]|uniref:macrolide family glycosyltransferase n=1 Tax=Shimazuella kribbensis TaxID=139808 RepID=UPI0004091C04|nr:macrolide family glycosyltransferase [Shimazuella kribbensis]
MSKVLFINYLGEGHINPSIGLVHELIQRGEEVVYYTRDPYIEKIAKTGAEVRSISQKAEQFIQESLQQLVHLDPKERLAKGNIPFNMDIMEWIVDDILIDIKLESYDYILYDSMTFPGKWIADIKKLPCVPVWTTFASNEKSNMFLHIMQQWSQEMQHALEKMRAETTKLRNRLEQKYQIAIPDFFHSFSSNTDFHLVFTSRLFQMDEQHFGDHYHFVGPSIMDRQDKLENFPFVKDGKPIVYMALGTIANNRPDLYRSCIEAFQDQDVKVIMSIGNQVPMSELGPIPANVFVYPYVPQLQVLNISDVFITHCGMNSTNEGLYFGNPLVMLPLMNDQPIVAQRVKNLGAGLILDHEKVDATMLREAVLEVLNNPVYKENSLKISHSFREAGGYIKAADELIKKVRCKQNICE